jgi:hypothetical protein
MTCMFKNTLLAIGISPGALNIAQESSRIDLQTSIVQIICHFCGHIATPLLSKACLCSDVVQKLHR